MAEAPNPQSNQRKLSRIFVNPRFQLNYIGTHFIIVFWIVVLLQGSHMYFVNHFVELAQQHEFGANHPIMEFLTYQQSAMAKITLLTCIGAGIVTLLFGAYISHKIAGPISRVKQFSDQLDKQNPEELKFRKSDYFPDLADSVNAIVRKLKGS